MEFIIILLHMVPLLVLGEKFSSGEDDKRYTELNKQWEYMSKFTYSAKGKITVTVKFNPTDPKDTAKLKLNFYQMSVEGWKRNLLKKGTSCHDRVSVATFSFELVNEETTIVEAKRRCFTFYEQMVCQITLDVNGKSPAGPWVFVALSYCDRDLSTRASTWQISSINGESFLTKHAPVSDSGLFLTFLILTIIMFLLSVFWMCYKKRPKLNARLFLPYRISMLSTILSFCLFTVYYGMLNKYGIRNNKTFNSALTSFTISYAFLSQLSLTATWAGSIVTTHLARWKSILSYLMSGVSLVVISVVYIVQYLDKRQTDVYLFQSDYRYLVWVILSLNTILWVCYTIPMLSNVASKDENVTYVRVFYMVFTLYQLGVPGIMVLANLNLQSVNRNSVVLMTIATLHVICYLFLFYCIKENHTLKSILHFLKKFFSKYVFCGFFCCRACTGASKDGSRTGCFGAGPAPDHYSGYRTDDGYQLHGADSPADNPSCCIKLFSCCPCVKYGAKAHGAHLADSKLDSILKSGRTDDRRFSLQITDMEQVETDQKRNKRAPTPESLIQSEPIVLKNMSVSNTNSSNSDPLSTVRESQAGEAAAKSNAKVIPWLYQEKKPQKFGQSDDIVFDLSPRASQNKWTEAVRDPALKVADHGYKAPPINPWGTGNHKPFATSQNQKIVLYKKPSSNLLFSSSTNSFDNFHGKQAEKPVNHFRDADRMTGLVMIDSPRAAPVSRSADFASVGRLVMQSQSMRKHKNSSNHDDLPSDDEGGERFNTREYNSRKIRSDKAAVTTMRYRRNTLKGALANIPTSLLLERVPAETVASTSKLRSESLMTPKIKVVKSINENPRSVSVQDQAGSKMWKMLSKKYTGIPLNSRSTDEKRIKTTIRAFRVNTKPN